MLDRKAFANILPPIGVVFLNAASRTLAFPVLISLVDSSSDFLPKDTPLKVRIAYLSVLLMLNPIFALLGSNYIGTLSDSIRRKNALYITTLGSILSLIFIGWMVILKSFVGVAIGRCFMGLFGGGKSVAMAAVVDRVKKEERSRAISLTNFGYILGIIVGPLLGGLFSNTNISRFFQADVPFFLGGCMGILGLIWIRYGFHDTFGKKHPRKWHWSELYAPFTRAFQHSRTRYLFPHILFLDISQSIFFFGVWTYLSDSLHIDSSTLGIYMATRGVVGLISSLFVITPLTHRKCTEVLVTYSMIGTAIVCVLQALFLNYVSTWILIVPFAALSQLNYTCAYANVSHAAGQHHQGWAMGMATGAISLGWMCASFTTNLIAEIGFANLLYVAAGCAIVSVLFIVIHRSCFHPHTLEEEIEPSGANQ